MELCIECESNLNKANFFERKADGALKNIAKYVRLLEVNYREAVNSLKNSIVFLESAQAELTENEEDEVMYILRLSGLQRQLEMLRPYRLFDVCALDKRPTAIGDFSSGKVLKQEFSIVSLPSAKDDKVSDRLNSQCLKTTAMVKKFPKDHDQQLEESSVRISELLKFIDNLSEQLSDSRKQAAEERSRRLYIEAELMACQHDLKASFADSFYETSSNSLAGVETASSLTADFKLTPVIGSDYSQSYPPTIGSSTPT